MHRLQHTQSCGSIQRGISRKAYNITCLSLESSGSVVPGTLKNGPRGGHRHSNLNLKGARATEAKKTRPAGTTLQKQPQAQSQTQTSKLARILLSQMRVLRTEPCDCHISKQTVQLIVYSTECSWRRPSSSAVASGKVAIATIDEGCEPRCATHLWGTTA